MNVQFLDGPYGGGMQFAHSVKSYLEARGITVTNSLVPDDLDIILHIAPFPFQQIHAYTYLDAYRYQGSHPHVKIIHRINECDERKQTHFMNSMLIEASRFADHLVYIASWLRPLLRRQGLSKVIPSTVILNGADHRIFNTEGKTNWNKSRKMRIVTHHWGGHSMKGHDTYLLLDSLLADKTLADKFEFTFVGNVPQGVRYRNTRRIAPLFGNALANELRSHDIYITASINEPAGMHHIEGALCGLPILYIESGALPEYCANYGLAFHKMNLVTKLLEMRERYDELREKLCSYPNTSDHMNEQYLELFRAITHNPNQASFNPPSFTPRQLAYKSCMLSCKSLLIRTRGALSRFVSP